jgi:uncharacterized protein
VWTVYVAFVVMIVSVLAFAVAWVVALMVALRLGPRSAVELHRVLSSPLGFVPSFLFNGVLMVGMSVALPLLARESLRQRLRVERPQCPIWAIPIAALGLVAWSWCLGILISFTGAHSNTLEMLNNMHNDADIVKAGWLILTVGLAAPIGEELFFRGYISTRLELRHGPWLGILITSIFFGILHMDLVHSAYALFLGLYLGYLTLRTGSILPALAGHLLNNLISTSLMLCFQGDPEQDASVGYKGIVLLLAGTVAAVGAVVTWWTTRRPIEEAVVAREGTVAGDKSGDAVLDRAG